MLPDLCSVAAAEDEESLGVTTEETVDVTEVGQVAWRMILWEAGDRGLGPPWVCMRAGRRTIVMTVNQLGSGLTTSWVPLPSSKATPTYIGSPLTLTS